MTNGQHGHHEADMLAQRFVDQDLSPAERVAFVSRLGRDADLRVRVTALEQLVRGASRLPKPAVSAAFVARALEETAAPAAVSIGARASRLEWLWAPRTLQWNLAYAVAGVALVVAATFAVARVTQPRGAAPARATAGTAADAPVMVRLVVLQADARTVHAVGDFNGWDPMRTSLEQVSNGVWTVTLPLEPGRYEYMFVVDGQRWVGDPSAAEQIDDGFGRRNAVLDVEPSTGGPL